MILEKICNKCGVTFPKTDKYFGQSTGKSGGFRRDCRMCQAEVAREYHQVHKDDPGKKEAARVKASQWHKENRERSNAQRRDKIQRDPEPNRLRQERYYAKPEKKAAKYTYNQGYKKRFRREVLMAYGGVCHCCREDNLDFLSLEHLNQRGKAHREELGSTMAVYHWARREGYPKTLSILCDSCNKAAYWNNGVCPHQDEVTALTGIKVINPHVTEAALAA